MHVNGAHLVAGNNQVSVEGGGKKSGNQKNFERGKRFKSSFILKGVQSWIRCFPFYLEIIVWWCRNGDFTVPQRKGVMSMGKGFLENGPMQDKKSISVIQR